MQFDEVALIMAAWSIVDVDGAEVEWQAVKLGSDGRIGLIGLVLIGLHRYEFVDEGSLADWPLAKQYNFQIWFFFVFSHY